MLKYLRIAITAMSLTACVLLIALWVRSYWSWDSLVFGITSQKGFSTFSVNGGMRLTYIDYSETPARIMRWKFRAYLPGGEIEPPPQKNWRVSIVRSPMRKPLTVTAIRTQLEIPHWFPVLLTATLAAIFWIPWRFSLRTLLIATTLVAVGLGAVIYLSG